MILQASLCHNRKPDQHNHRITVTVAAAVEYYQLIRLRASSSASRKQLPIGDVCVNAPVRSEYAHKC